ncbi:MAG TPA: glycerophosphodiester phosphodiesterase, partial [Pyrinomonadaceae bacterium]|nr:glycerophosphodiester phosphodiesterase [Pyrinomonadaceae bacterium]
DALALEVVQLIRAHGLAERVVVESFTLDSIKEIKRLAPEVKTAALFERRLARPLPSPRRILAQALQCQAHEIALHHSLASRAMIRAATSAGFQTVAWTIDDTSWAERAVALGLKAIITNYPATMCAARDTLRAIS